MAPAHRSNSVSTGGGARRVTDPLTRRQTVDFALNPAAAHLKERLVAFMDEYVYPAEDPYDAALLQAGDPHHHPDLIEGIKAEAKHQGLWNLFLPEKTEWTEGLSNLDYAPLAETMGRSSIASECFNCSAPDTGNMELLARFGTNEQRQRWLKPLLDGEIRSCFAMTEPAVASSDATNISTRIVQDGDEYVISGRKWFVSGAMHPHCQLSLVMGVTDPEGPRHAQQSIVLVPMDSPGLKVVRNMQVFGYDDPEGHCEVIYDHVRVPVEYCLEEEGSGFRVAQARLGPGRIHHCMRTIGAAERALELMCDRLGDRVAFGQPIARQGVWEERVANARIALDQARLYVMHAAWRMDQVGNQEARGDIAGIKVAVPRVAQTIIDDAIQAFGAAGMSQDTPLARTYSWIRALRIADGPDEVHRRTVARLEFAKAAGQ
jgi:acyl-CoA dehydrogenase